MIIGSVFLNQVRKSGICLEEDDSEAGTSQVATGGVREGPGRRSSETDAG
jgi:hypothetical protein